MNAARPFFSGGFTSASLSPTPVAPTPSPVAPRRASARAKARLKRSAQNQAPEAPPCDEYSSCLVQARICRDQAQEAARLKRFQSAVGLFQTAISLCQRAVSLRKSLSLAPAQASESSDGEAHEYMKVLATEMSAYDELARSMNRPLLEGR